MRAWPLTAIVFGALLGFAGVAQAQDPHRPAVGGIGSPIDAMIFYVAHGADGACGPGCSDWIVAESAGDRFPATIPECDCWNSGEFLRLRNRRCAAAVSMAIPGHEYRGSHQQYFHACESAGCQCRSVFGRRQQQ